MTRKPTEERLLAKLNKVSDDGCWLWTGTRNDGGYGRIRADDGKSWLVHRWMYVHHVGEIPNGFVIDHLCHVRHCCNPAHLRAVSQRENARNSTPREDSPAENFIKYPRGLSTEERFWAKVHKTDACWEWVAGIADNGYGIFRGSDSKTTLAHRFSYLMHCGNPPEGFVVDHLCFNRKCVRPDHLEAVSRQANSERRKGANRNSSTGVRGVSYLPKCTNNPWYVQVRHRGRLFSGSYPTLEEADRAAKALRLKLHIP